MYSITSLELILVFLILSPISLPQGIQHIAKRLEIDAVPAMVGWTFHKAGWAHPEYDGFVVCREVLPVLVDAWRAERMSAAAVAAADRTERALTNWKRITRNLLLWQRIEAGFQLAKATVHATPLVSRLLMDFFQTALKAGSISIKNFIC